MNLVKEILKLFGGHMDRIYNFSAGPAMLPEEVLQQAQKDMMNYQGKGLSVMEMSHRSKPFLEIYQQTEQSLRNLMKIPENYKVLFLQGGAHTQFAMVPLNLMRNNKKADYVISGHWAKRAYLEAKKYGAAKAIASSEEDNFSTIPEITDEMINADSDYIHICVNNTIYGTRFKPDNLPKKNGTILVGDMSSNILSEEYDINQFGLVYAGAQKNMGPAGVTVVIIREDLIPYLADKIPTMLQYKVHADANSMYNTPPCFAIYMCGLVYQWIENSGGIETMEQMNKQKAKLLYDFLDDSDFYRGTADKSCRSLMNVPFVCKNENLHEEFIQEANANGLQNLKGHRSVGGMRASVYNAMPQRGVEALIQFMKDFEMKNKV